MEQSDQEPLTPHGVIGARVKELRRDRGWSAERLAERMTEVGVPWSRVVVTKLETGRRPGVSVEELFALAYVLNVAPLHLMVPPLDGEQDERARYQVTPAGPVHIPSAVRAWIRGQWPVGDVDARRYFAQVPDSEWQPPPNVAYWSSEISEETTRRTPPTRGRDDAG